MNIEKQCNEDKYFDWEVRTPSDEYKNLPKQVRNVVDNHLSAYPVRLGDLAKSLNAKVLISTLPRDISGQIEKTNEGFIIKVNRHEAKHRQRFTLAHELAHLILHKSIIEGQETWSESVLLRAPNQPLAIEYQANRLASDLIMPYNLVQEATSDYGGRLKETDIEELARLFGVSKSAMEIKLQIS